MKTMKTVTITPVLAAFALALVPASLHAKVIKVPSKTIQTIQQGVDAAAPGDTVLVMPGTYDYYGGAGVNIWSDKNGLKLKAAGVVTIVGPGGEERSGTGITIYADNVSVEGFDISGFGRGIVAWFQTEGTSTRIIANTVEDCVGVCIELRGSGNYEVAHNTVSGGSIGIFLAPESVANPQHHLHHNLVTDAEWQGIMIATAPGSSLDHNVCDNNGWEGIYVAGSPNSSAKHNHTDRNGWAGIEVGNSPDCVLTGNEANDNAGYHPEGDFYGGIGIYVWSSCGSTFERNAARGNILWDLASDDSSTPPCSTYVKNRADTASPSFDVWDVKPAEE